MSTLLQTADATIIQTVVSKFQEQPTIPYNRHPSMFISPTFVALTRALARYLD